METCFNYTDKEKCWVSSDEQHWISRIRKLAEEYPEEVRIICQPEQNDGCVYATLPPKWIKLRPPMQLTDDQKKVRAELARKHFNL